MKKIRSEVERLMQISAADSGAPVASFCFPPDFPGFQGHFPDKAILPGACQLQCFLSLLEHCAGKPLVLKEIILTKYFLPVRPDETISCTFTDLPANMTGSFTVKGKMFRGEERIAEMRLLVASGE